ncbi:hypothetical protein BASA50_004538 [Batrachochytrium salamandrivorans]|uniref:VWFD domain-containing protein n=1 Tax=Batrachochytrium salamandrivorans TaxID=1357716 RepID=A0ABQ8FFA3_9FUNG|nr:hypothetical protein BASA50_004538 [Batrachochytrium salamandrivorans]
MLSRLIVTFLCAAAIGSVSGAFMTFDPAPVVFEDIEAPISISAKLNSKPTEETIGMFHSSSLQFLPPGTKPSHPPRQPKSISEFLAKAVTVGSLSAELSTTDALEVIKKNLDASFCSIKKSEVETFDEMFLPFNKPGWYQMASTRDIEVQVFMNKCTEELSCPTKVLARYGSSVMIMDVSGPVKNLREYSVTEVTQNTNGLRYLSNTNGNEHKINFPYGSELYLKLLNNDGIVSLRVDLIMVAGYSSSRGLCNIPRPFSLRNKLVGPDGKLYKSTDSEIDAFTDSWKNPRNPPPKPVIPVPPPPTTTTTTTTMDFSTHVLSFTVDLSESTLSPTITYVLSSTTITTSPSTTSTTSPYPPSPPYPGGYVPPPPPAPGGYVPPPPPPSSQPDVVVEIQRFPKPAKI